MNSWPSWRSPVRGMKSSPVWQVRESVLTPQKVSQAPWLDQGPPGGGQNFGGGKGSRHISRWFLFFPAPWRGEG